MYVNHVRYCRLATQTRDCAQNINIINIAIFEQKLFLQNISYIFIISP